MTKLQLFCIPFAGGSAAYFNELAGYINSEIEVIKIEYPGRGYRTKENFLESINDLIYDVKKSIVLQRKENLPFAVLGYSLGSAIAYELLQYGFEVDKPVYAFMAAREALYLDNPSKRYDILSEDEFVEKIKLLGGLDERIIQNKRFRKIFMKPIFADYKLWGQYKYDDKRVKPTINMTVFYSENDTPYTRIEGWKRLTAGSVDFYEFGQNHFFIKHHAIDIAEIINEKLLGLIK